MNNIVTKGNNSIDLICTNSVGLIKYARDLTIRQVNSMQSMSYYCIGKWIVEEQ